MFILILCFFLKCLSLFSVNLKCSTDDKGMSMQMPNCEVFSLFTLMLHGKGYDNIMSSQAAFEMSVNPVVDGIGYSP